MRFQVDSEAVTTASHSIQGSVGHIQTEVLTLNGQITSLQALWTGPAATAFQGAATDWNAIQNKVTAALTALNSALGTAGIQYADLEAANARLFAH